MVGAFDWPIRVYFEDTDSGGVVYHSNYLKFMERGRTEWLRSLGLNQTKLRYQDNIMFVVAKLNIAYKKAAYFNDELVIKTQLKKIGASTIFLTQDILREGQLISASQVEIACINGKLFKPQRIPKLIKQLMETL